MTPLTVSKQTPLSEVIVLMSHDRQTCYLTCDIAPNAPTANSPQQASLAQPSSALSCAVIVENDKPIGIFTERDLVRLAAQGAVIANQAVETVMTSPLISINQKNANDLFTAVSLLRQYRIRHLPVVDDDGKLVDILTRESIRQCLQPSDLLRIRYVAETMTPDVIQAAPTATLQSITQLMTQHRVSCVVIVETIGDKTCPLGIVTEGDIVQFQALQLDFSRLTAQSVMSFPVFCASLKITLWHAHQLMVERRITHLVITHGDGSLAGILTQTTILKSFNPAEMVEVISLLQQQVERLETEKLQLLKACNAELKQAVDHELATHQQTELRLRESEQRYAALAAMVPVVIFQTDISGACTYVNEYWTELTGMSQQEALGQGWFKGLHPDDQQQVITLWQQTIQTGQPLQLEYRFQLPDGSIKWVYEQAQPERDNTGKISGYVGSITNISDRKQTELALRESEQRFRRAIADAPVPIMIHAEDGEVLQISSTWTELTGYTHADIPTTQAWTERAYGDQTASIVDDIISQEYSLEARCEEGEFTVTTHDGQQRIWSFSSATLGQLPDGRRIAIAMAADITEKHQTQTALQVSENRYRALVEIIPDLLIRQDAEGNYLDLVMSNEVSFIRPDLVHSGITIYDLLPLELAQQRMVYVHQALQTGEVQIYDFEIEVKGKLHWQESRIIAINQKEVLVIVRDISERKDAETQLQATSQRLQQAQRIAHLGHWELNLQSNNLYWSDEVFRIFEIDQSYFGASYEAFLKTIHPDDREMVSQTYNQHVQNGIPYSIVHRLLMTDGRIKYVQEQCETTQDSDGRALISCGTVLDITSLKEAEYQRQQAEASLRQIVEGTATVIERDFFQELVQHIAVALDVRYTSISEAKSDRFSVIAFCADRQLQTIDDCRYDQLPCCVQALQHGQCFHSDSLLELYPENELFNSLNAESYLGIGLRNSKGEPIGNLCIMHDRPLNNSEWMISLLKIFGARAGAELERYQTARQLQTLTNELEQRVIDRTATLAETVEHLKAEIKRRQALANLLLESREQLQDIFDSANDMIQSVSLIDGSFEFVNRAWLDTLGYNSQDLEELTIFDVLHPNCQEHCESLMQRLQTGQLQHLDQVEITFVAKDGRVIEAEGNVNCRIIDGQTVYTRGIFRDISERKKNQAKLHNLSTRLSLAVKSGGIGIWEWDPISERLTWDNRMCELYGIQSEDFQGYFTDWANRVHPEDLVEAQAKFQQAINGQKEIDIEFRVLQPNGQSRYIKANGLTEHNAKGDPTRVIGINFDISDLKKAEIEIIKALEQERELNEMKSRFVSNTSHEFRTPLTVIYNNAELLKLFDDKLDKTEKQKCLDTILNYVDHTTELIDEVLIVSRAESGKIELRLKPLDVIEFSQELNQTIGLNAPNHHLAFVVQDARSQSQKHSYNTQLDSKILQQSLTNLLTNAIKYSPEGSTITFQVELLPNSIRFVVIDKGIGIPEEDQKYLFEPFHRATNVGVIPGTGLGLSIVKHLISVHQGSINVKSTPGEGSCFTATIPTQWQEVDP